MTDIHDIPSEERETSPTDYDKSYSEFQQKVRSLELLFADVYRRASLLEKELKN